MVHFQGAIAEKFVQQGNVKAEIWLLLSVPIVPTDSEKICFIGTDRKFCQNHPFVFSNNKKEERHSTVFVECLSSFIFFEYRHAEMQLAQTKSWQNRINETSISREAAENKILA